MPVRLPRLLLADDHPVVLAGVRSLLESEVDLIGAVQDGRALVEAALRLRPDVILLDISMPMLNGIDAARQIRKDLPEAKIIFLTMHSDPDYVREALRAGAAGFVLKSSAGAELLEAIHTVLQGKFYLTRLIGEEVWAGVGREDRKVFSELTSRQREVLQLIAEGRTAKEIADILSISVKTVEFHKARLVQVLGLHSIAAMTRYAIEHGLVEV